MLAKFMCLTIDTTILHIDSVAQYRLVFDARVADMKRRRFGNLDRGNYCRPDLIQFLQCFHRGTQESGERTQFFHEPLRHGFGITVWISGIKDHLQQFKFGQGRGRFVDYIVSHTPLVPGYIWVFRG